MAFLGFFYYLKFKLKLCRSQHGVCLLHTICLIKKGTKPFLDNLEEAPWLQALIRGSFYHPDFCFEGCSAKHKHYRRFPGLDLGPFLDTGSQQANKVRCSAGPVTKKEELVGDMKVFEDKGAQRSWLNFQEQPLQSTGNDQTGVQKVEQAWQEASRVKQGIPEWLQMQKRSAWRCEQDWPT